MSAPQSPGYTPGGVAGALDIISQNSGEAVRKLHARDLAASVTTAIFRLVKVATLHSLENQAMVRQVEETVQIVSEYGARTGHNVSLLFAQQSVFVGGQLLRANRGVYEGALELGEILKRVGAAEIGIMKEARAQDFFAFASALTEALRHPRPPKVERPSPRIRLRALSASALGREILSNERVDPNTQVARIYASAIVIMRRFFEALKKGKYDLPQRVKRVAQRLVDLSTGETPAFLGVTAARNANHDEAGRAVNTAILALSMARQITNDPVMLVRIAMAALLFDCARARLAGVVGENGPAIMPQLSESQENDSPAATAVVLTALSRVNEPGVMRTVINYEAHWVKRAQRLGPLYRGIRPPSLQARIIHLARAFNDALTPAPGESPALADQVIAGLEASAADSADRTVLRLLVGALGIFPAGTLVELSTGEVALITQTPSHPSLYSQPRIRIVFDATGGALQRPIEVDLSQRARQGEPARQIRRVVATFDDPSAAGLRQHVGQPVQHMASLQPTQQQMTAAQMQQMQQQVQQMQQQMPQMQQQMQQMQQQMPQPMQTPTTSGIRPQAEPSSYPSAQTPISVPSHQQQIGFGAPQPYDPAYARQASPAPARPPAAAPAADPYGHQDGGFSTDPAAFSVDETNAGLEALGDEPYEHAHATRAITWTEHVELLEQEQVIAREEKTNEPESPTDEDEAGAAQGEAPLDVIEVGPDGVPVMAPTAEGTFGKTPLVHLLVYMLDQKLTGTTIITAPDETRHTLYFHGGAVAKIRTGAMVAPLDRVILDQGLLDEPTLRGTLMEISKKQMLHGRHLVQKGLLQSEVVLQVLRTQLLSKLTVLFEMPPETTYAYYDGINLLESYAGPELTPYDPLAVIMAGVRLRANDRLVDATLEKIATRPLSLHKDAQMKRFELHKDEGAIVDLLRTRPMTLAEILDAGVARQERIVRLTLYALAITRHLDLGVAGRALVGAGVDIASMPARQPEGGPPIRQLTPPPAERQPTGPSGPIERQPTGSSPGQPVGRQITGTGPAPGGRQITGVSPAQGERQPTGPHTPPERQPTGPSGARVVRQSTLASRQQTPPPAPAERQPTPPPNSRETPSGSSSAERSSSPPSQRSAPPPARSSDEQMKRTGFGMGFGASPAKKEDSRPGPPPAKPTTKVPRQSAGASAPPTPAPTSDTSGVQSAGRRASDQRARHSSDPAPVRQREKSPRAQPMAHSDSPVGARAALAEIEHDHFPRPSFSPDPVPMRLPPPPGGFDIPPPEYAPYAQPMPQAAQPSFEIDTSPPYGDPRVVAAQQAMALGAGPQAIAMPPGPQAIAMPPGQQAIAMAPTMVLPIGQQQAPMQQQMPMQMPIHPSQAPMQRQSVPPQYASVPPQHPSVPPMHQHPSAPPMHQYPSVPPMHAQFTPSTPPPASPSMAPPQPIQSNIPPARSSAPAAARPRGQQPPQPQPSSPPARPKESTSPGNTGLKAPLKGDPVRRAEIEKRAGAIESEDFFTILGVSRAATADQVQKAFFALVKAWHPDRVPNDLEDLKPQVAKVFARLNEAYQTLNDAQKRREYTQLVDQGGGVGDDTEKIARVVDAALEFQKAEILMKKLDLAGAEALARRAVQADPEQPDYLTLLTWIQAQRRGDPPPLKDGQTTSHYDDLIRTLDGIISSEPQYEKALFYRGMLLKRAGRIDRAMRDFRMVAEVNPKNIDAVREVRLFEMRKRGAKKGGGGGDDGGLFGKFFKR